MPSVSSANKPHMVVNGQPCVLPAGADATTTLLHVLRNDLCLKEILQNPPQCLVHVSMQWHPHRP